MAGEWFYQAKGQQLGPVVSAELRRLADTGVVTPDTLVCRATATGMADGRWVCAERVQGIFQRNESPPTEAVRHVEGKPVSRVAASFAEKERQSSPSPPPLPPTIPPVSPDSPRRKRVSRLAAALAAGGAVTTALLAAILMVHHSGKEVISAQTATTIPSPPDDSAIVPVQTKPSAQPSAQHPAPSAPSITPKDAGHPIGKALDSVALYANTRGAVATILTKDDLGFDAFLGSGFFIASEFVGKRYRDFALWRRKPTGTNMPIF